MPNATAKALEQRLLSALPPNQDYRPSDWRTAVVPRVVQSFLRHRLLEKLDGVVHQMRQHETEWVHTTAPELETARAAFEDALRDNGQIPESAWASMIRQASHVGMAYLVRPIPTAAAYLFEGEDKTLSVAYIAYRMQALAPYEYLRQGLDAFARHRDVQRLDPKTFRTALTRIDRMLTEDYTVDRWLDTLQPLFEATETAYGNAGCPARVLHRFFAHKQQQAYADRLSDLPDDQSLSLEDLQHLMEADDTPDTFSDEDFGAVLQALNQETEAKANKTAPESTSEPTIDDNEEPTSPFAPGARDQPFASSSSPDTDSTAPPEPSSNSETSPDQSSPEPATEDEPSEPTWDVPGQARPIDENGSSSNDPREPTPRWKQFHKGNASPAETQEEAASNARWKQFNPKATPGGNESISVSDRVEELESDVFGESPPTQRDIFLRQLFNDSTDQYAQVLQRLREAGSWNEASQIIAQDVFRKNKINIYSDAAVSFTNAVERRYR